MEEDKSHIIECRANVSCDMNNGFSKILNEVNDKLIEENEEPVRLAELALAYCSVVHKYFPLIMKRGQDKHGSGKGSLKNG